VVAGKKSGSHSVKGKHLVTEKKTSAKPHAIAHTSAVVTIERRDNRDRRATEQRNKDIAVAMEHRMIERRTKVARRRQIDPTTCERDYTPDEIEFMSAMDEYKRRNGRMFPTCSEVLEVIKLLGYQKCPQTQPTALPGIDLPVVMGHDSTVAV
jgi:hypothetical protein